MALSLHLLYEVAETLQQLDAAKRHFEEQISTYGETSLVNLVNHKGHEMPVKEAYEHAISEVNLRFRCLCNQAD